MNRKTMPTTHAELRRVVGNGRRVLCNNTTAVYIASGDYYEVRLHGHTIAVVTANNVAVRHCGYVTTTTFDRLKRFVPAGWGVSRANGEPHAFHVASGTVAPITSTLFTVLAN